MHFCCYLCSLGASECRRHTAFTQMGKRDDNISNSNRNKNNNNNYNNEKTRKLIITNKANTKLLEIWFYVGDNVILYTIWCPMKRIHILYNNFIDVFCCSSTRMGNRSTFCCCSFLLLIFMDLWLSIEHCRTALKFPPKNTHTHISSRDDL